jgi:hypothetical protein
MDEITNFLLGSAIAALVASHIAVMLKVHGHDFDLHRVFDRLKMNRKG